MRSHYYRTASIVGGSIGQGVVCALMLVLILCGAAACRTKAPVSPAHVTPITKPEKPQNAGAAESDDETTSGSAAASEMRGMNPQSLGEGARLLVGREFEPVYFDNGGTELDGEARRRLTEYAGWLKQPGHEHVWIALVGYCDGGQGVRFGFDLAMARAFAVEEFLATNGLDRKKIFSIGYGRATDEPTSNRVEVLGFVGPENEGELGKVTTEPESAPAPEKREEI